MVRDTVSFFFSKIGSFSREAHNHEMFSACSPHDSCGRGAKYVLRLFDVLSRKLFVTNVPESGDWVRVGGVGDEEFSRPDHRVVDEQIQTRIYNETEHSTLYHKATTHSCPSSLTRWALFWLLHVD